MSETLLAPDQLAERWQVPKAHVYRLVRDGRLPVVKIGRYYRFRLETIEKWERASENRSGHHPETEEPES